MMDLLNLKSVSLICACLIIFIVCSMRALKGFNLWRKGQIVDAEIIGYRYLSIPWYPKMPTQFNNKGFYPVAAFQLGGEQRQITLEKERLLKPAGHKVRVRVSGKKYLSLNMWAIDLYFVLIVMPYLLISSPTAAFMFLGQEQIFRLISSIYAYIFLPTLIFLAAVYLLTQFFHAKSLRAHKPFLWEQRVRLQNKIPKINAETAKAMETKDLVAPEDVLAYKYCAQKTK